VETFITLATKEPVGAVERPESWAHRCWCSEGE